MTKFSCKDLHSCPTFVDFTDLVGFSGVEQNSFGGCGLSCIDVSHNPNVSVQVQIDLTLLSRRGDLFVNILCLRRHGKWSLFLERMEQGKSGESVVGKKIRMELQVMITIISHKRSSLLRQSIGAIPKEQ